MALDNASLLSQLMERSQMQRVDIFNLQSRNNVFSNTYNSDWSDHSNSMWWEPQNAQQGGYWQPPQPHIQYAQPNLSSSIDYNQKIDELICLVQGLQNQDNEAQQEGYWQPYEEFYSTPMQPPQPAQTNSGTSLYNDTVIKLLTNLSEGQENQNKAMQNQDKRVDHLEKQIGQIAEFV